MALSKSSGQGERTAVLILVYLEFAMGTWKGSNSLLC